ncbi:AfsR/SARP family transcriptional regulator [Nocardiopsis oceani]
MNGGRNIALGPKRQRTAFAALLADADSPVSMDTLISRIWDESPPSGVRNVVYTYIARIRRILAHCDAGVPLIKDTRGYRLAVDPLRVDLHRVRFLLTESRTAPGLPTSSDRLAEAISLWSSDPLTGITTDWANRFREGLRPLKDELLCAWADSEIQAGRASATIQRLTTELLESPLSEHLHERLIQALYLSGQRSHALESYNRMRHRLAEELGTDPGVRLQELHQKILRGDFPAETPPVELRHRADPRTAQGDPPLVPTSMPTDVDGFSGREQETEQLLAHFGRTHARPPVAVISGGVGIGKTELALRVAHEVASHYPDGQFFVSSTSPEGRPECPADLMEALLKALGEKTVPDSACGRAMRLRLLLANLRVLILLDNAVDAEPFASLVPKVAGCGLILTSRSRLYLPRAQLIYLKEFSEHESMRMLRETIGRARVDREPCAAENLVRMCDGLPLALRAVAARLATHPYWSLRRLVELMYTPAGRLDEIRYGGFDVQDCFDNVLRTLDPALARFFLDLGSVAGRDWFSAEQVSTLLGSESLTRARSKLEQLADQHLLRVHEAKSQLYRFGALQHVYARAGSGTG